MDYNTMSHVMLYIKSNINILQSWIKITHSQVFERTIVHIAYGGINEIKLQDLAEGYLVPRPSFWWVW